MFTGIIGQSVDQIRNALRLCFDPKYQVSVTGIHSLKNGNKTSKMGWCTLYNWTMIGDGAITLLMQRFRTGIRELSVCSFSEVATTTVSLTYWASQKGSRIDVASLNSARIFR